MLSNESLRFLYYWWILISASYPFVSVTTTEMEFTPETFLKKIQASNPEFGCEWILIHFQIQEDLNWDSILERIQSPHLILDDNFNQSLQTYPERRRFSSFCRLVTFGTDSLDIDYTKHFLMRSNWAQLLNVRTTLMMETYFLFFNFNPDSIRRSGNLSGLVLSLLPFPLWHPFKAFVQWDKYKTGFEVTNLCWHCSEAEPFQSGNQTYYLKRHSMSSLNNSSETYKVSSIFPGYTENLNQKSLLMFKGEIDMDCTELHKLVKQRHYSFWIPFSWLTIAAISTQLNFTCEIATHVPEERILEFGMRIEVPLLRINYKLFDISPSLAYDRISFCYVEALPGHSWNNIFYPFQRFVWLVLLITWIGISIFLWSVFPPVGIQCWIWTTYAVLLLQDLNLKVTKMLSHRQNPNFRLRLVIHIGILTWLLCCMIIVAAYCSQLSSLLTHPRSRQSSPENFQDLIDRDWEVGTSHQYFMNDTSGTSAFITIRDRLTHFESLRECISSVLSTPKFACVGMVMVNTINRNAKAYMYLNNKLDAAERFKIAPDQTFNSIVVGLGWPWWIPYRKHFAEIVTHLHSGGFPKFWDDLMSIENLIRIREMSSEVMKKSSDHNRIQVMSLAHLQGSYYILISGLGLSLAVFLVEFVNSKFHEIGSWISSY